MNTEQKRNERIRAITEEVLAEVFRSLAMRPPMKRERAGIPWSRAGVVAIAADHIRSLYESELRS